MRSYCHRPVLGSLLFAVLGFACSDDPEVPQRGNAADLAGSAANDAGDVTRAQEDSAATTEAPGAILYRRDVAPVKRVEDALPATFIPPYEDCRDPAPGQTGLGSGGKVCTNVAISACTEPGKRFADYADCAVVRRQRPYWPAPPARASRSGDPRLSDPAYLRESSWVTEQIEASGCSCCHDSRVIAASQWDIALGPLWLDSLSDTGLALFAGLADSSVLGVYPPAQNHGFDRDITGIPSTDSARMKAHMLAELARRGLTESWALAVPPFGGPIYTASVQKPTRCGAGEGVDVDGSVRWNNGDARYIYLLAPGSKNPGVPPNLDLPTGTLWRLDVLASSKALASGTKLGFTPAGSFQAYPEATPLAPLVRGQSYQLVVLRDIGLPIVNCLFEFGTPLAAAPVTPTPAATVDAGSGYPVADAGANAGGRTDAAVDGGMCTLAGGDSNGFGAPCNDATNHSDCPCAANYCSKSPFDTKGYCSASGCKENPGICPSGFRCLDLSTFGAGLPAVCARP